MVITVVRLGAECHDVKGLVALNNNVDGLTSFLMSLWVIHETRMITQYSRTPVKPT